MAEKDQSAGEKARRVIAKGLPSLGWKEADLGHRRKSDVGKVKIARRLRRETTAGKRWIAQHFAMGSVSNVTLCLSAVGSQ